MIPIDKKNILLRSDIFEKSKMFILAMLLMALFIPNAYAAVTLHAGDIVKPNASSAGHYIINNTISLAQVEVNSTHAKFIGLDSGNQNIIVVDGAGNLIEVICQGHVNCTMSQTSAVKNLKFTEMATPATDTTNSPGGWGGSSNLMAKTITLVPKDDSVLNIFVNLNSKISNPSITAATILTVPVSSPTEPVYIYLNITKKNFNNSQIDNATIYFKVNKSWILANGLTDIYLGHYDNGWSKLKTDFINSSATVNYYRAYANALSYFAIIGEKSGATQTSPVIETQDVNEETAELPKEPIVEEPKATSSYIIYFIAAIILLIAAYAATKIKTTKENKAPQNKPVIESTPEPKAKYSAPLRVKKSEIHKTNFTVRKDDFNGIKKGLRR